MNGRKMPQVKHFTHNKDLIAAVKRAKGDIFGEVLAGGGCDPIDIKLYKKDAVDALERQGDWSQPPFYIVEKEGCTFLCANHNH